MGISAYKYKFNKQFKLISRYHSVLLVDKIVGTDEYKFTHCNKTDVQSAILPTYKTDTLYVSTINLSSNTEQAVITSDTWIHINDIQITKCDVQHLTADTATVKTNTDVDAITGDDIDFNTNFIATKYFIDWQKCNAFKRTRDQIAGDGLSVLGHITSDLKDANYMVGVFNVGIGDCDMNSSIYNITMGGKNYDYKMGVDRNNINNYTTCGFTVGVEPADNTPGNTKCVVGFRKKYIVEITNKELDLQINS